MNSDESTFFSLKPVVNTGAQTNSFSHSLSETVLQTKEYRKNKHTSNNRAQPTRQ